MALGLGINWLDRIYGTAFAPGENVLCVHCLIVRDDIVPEDHSALSESELASAIEMIREIIPDDELERLAPTGPATVYTTTITIWMLILQRLGKGRSLTNVVKDVLSRNRQLLPDNRRVREKTLSETSGAYSDARKRLPLEVVEHFATHVCESFIQQTPSWFGDQRAFIIDGTTITLSPTSQLREAYPPATNQYGETVWPVMLMLVAHELQSGAALPPELGAMYGDGNTSEAKLAAKLANRIPPQSVVFADSGFGIFSVAHGMTDAGHQILFRLTKSRFKSMRRQAELLEKTEFSKTYRLMWTPSAKDRKTNPDLPDDACVDVFLHEVELDNGETLFLVTTLGIRAENAAEFYSRRYDVEHDIRDLKVSMALETIRCRSESMVKKELLTSVVAYNLVVQFRRQAAEVAQLPPRRLSFKEVWYTFQSFLLNQPPCSAPQWQERYSEALRIASKDKLPNRPGRSYKRKAHPRRPKSTKFMKSENKNEAEHSQKAIPEKPK
jgi:hypothetical protein